MTGLKVPTFKQRPKHWRGAHRLVNEHKSICTFQTDIFVCCFSDVNAAEMDIVHACLVILQVFIQDVIGMLLIV